MERNEGLKILPENTRWTGQMIICQRHKMDLQGYCPSATFPDMTFLTPWTAFLIVEDLTKPHSRSRINKEKQLI